MTPMKKCLVGLLIVAAISECVHGAKRPTTTTSQISDLSRKLDRLEQKVSTLQRDVALLKKTNGQLTSQIQTANNEIQRVSSRNDGLQEMLSQFEKFFGHLYTESGAFDTPIGSSVDKRINKINSFVGDSEAALVGMNPDILYTKLGVPHDTAPTNVSEEMMAKAVMKLATENKEMSNKVNSLEAKVVESSKSSSRGISTAELELTKDRVDKLEEMVTILIVDNERTATAARTAGQQAEYEEMVEEALVSARSASTTRKSVFSAARNNDLLGTYYPQTITFDHTFVNKGGDFNAENGTFNCEWTGYYFFTFTLRTLDHHYIGVTLMKTSAATGNTEVVTGMYIDQHERNTMESQSVSIHLQTGDTVWLRLGPSDQYAVSSDTFLYTTFTGFLIYKGN
ncbi:uncharacterized protein LOC117100489 [Anneissia japonica]|uniref:uncharacterized protein LOC117100489 n=1 Tax=Anneissia japonica TaxID=1529436 RepID=UPI0014256019|nr:uncharacterized protein LOC117100489 [Anneissia japonica]XP_033096087.1 uncharacterized protein LOC117100489 [Anneissia japonica]XP_033096088.1 uncharacterized protein LOC117100489 [Anneissia japonica]